MGGRILSRVTCLILAVCFNRFFRQYMGRKFFTKLISVSREHWFRAGRWTLSYIWSTDYPG